MNALWLVSFVVFFGIIGPAFLYWLSRFLRTNLKDKFSFIGFPQDGPTPGNTSSGNPPDVPP